VSSLGTPRAALFFLNLIPPQHFGAYSAYVSLVPERSWAQSVFFSLFLSPASEPIIPIPLLYLMTSCPVRRRRFRGPILRAPSRFFSSFFFGYERSIFLSPFLDSPLILRSSTGPPPALDRSIGLGFAVVDPCPEFAPLQLGRIFGISSTNPPPRSALSLL